MIRTLDDKQTTYTTTDQTKVIKHQLCLHLLDFDSKVLHEKMNRLIDPTKSNNFLRLLILITFIFNCTAGAQSEKYETNASANSFKRRKKTEGSLLSVNDERKRREINTKPLWCSNDMAFPDAKDKCFYDRACFTIFSDCCLDYKKFCGPQELNELKISI